MYDPVGYCEILVLVGEQVQSADIYICVYIYISDIKLGLDTRTITRLTNKRTR